LAPANRVNIGQNVGLGILAIFLRFQLNLILGAANGLERADVIPGGCLQMRVAAAGGACG
jgi:hypothetical protein